MNVISNNPLTQPETPRRPRQYHSLFERDVTRLHIQENILNFPEIPTDIDVSERLDFAINYLNGVKRILNFDDALPIRNVLTEMELNKLVNDNEVCPICTENYVLNNKSVCKTDCCHHFHVDCLNDWNKNTCPMCRKTM